MKKLLLIGLILALILSTGCWDMIEINQRIFPYSVGFDLNNKENDEFNITFSYPNLNALGKNPVQKERVHIITTTGSNIFEAIHNLSSRLQYPIYNKHLKVLIISEDVARDDKYVREIIDGINRDFIINKGIQLVVIRDKAEVLLQSIPNASRQEVVEGTLYSILTNQQKSSNFTPKTLTNFIGDMDNRGVSILPLVRLREDEFEFSGGGIFKEYKLIGYIDHMENKSIAILDNQLSADRFNVEYNDISLSVLATGFKSKKRLMDSENLKIKFSVEIEAQIEEYTLADGVKIDSEEIVKGMEEVLARDIENNLNKTIQKLQKEYKADVIKVADYLRKYHNKLWKQVENNWEEVFSTAEITADVVVKIRRRGLTK